MTKRMPRAAVITLLLCSSESEKARYRKMSNDRNATRTPNDWDTTRTQNDWDATRTQDDWDAARTLSYEDVPNTLYESPAANRVQYAPNVEKPTGMAAAVPPHRRGSAGGNRRFGILPGQFRKQDRQFLPSGQRRQYRQ